MHNLFNKVDMILHCIDFENIWPGFSMYGFALYDNVSVYMKNDTIPYDRRFLGNTAIEYDGEFIAIWYIVNPLNEDPQLLASNLVHEMFHAYQRTHGESRYPSDLMMLDYPENYENYKLKYIESKILAEAYSCIKHTSQRELLYNFVAVRKHRGHVIGSIIDQEYYIETIEGIAEYAGCMALKQISTEKYKSRMNEYIEILNALDSCLFDIRRMLYYVGAIFCVLLSESGIAFKHEIGKVKTPLYYIIARDAKIERPSISCIDESVLLSRFETHMRNKKAKFEEFLQTHKEKVDEEFVICGYDPMNMIKIDDMILCNHFIMLTNENRSEPLFIAGQILLIMKKGSISQVHSYIK